MQKGYEIIFSSLEISQLSLVSKKCEVFYSKLNSRLKIGLMLLLGPWTCSSIFFRPWTNFTSSRIPVVNLFYAGGKQHITSVISSSYLPQAVLNIEYFLVWLSIIIYQIVFEMIVKILYIQPDVDEIQSASMLEDETSGMYDYSCVFTVVPSGLVGLELCGISSFDVVFFAEDSVTDINAQMFAEALNLVSNKAKVIFIKRLKSMKAQYMNKQSASSECGSTRYVGQTTGMNYLTYSLPMPFTKKELCTVIRKAILDSIHETEI